MPRQPGWRTSYLYLPCSWDDRHETPCPIFYWLRWGLTDLLLWVGNPCDLFLLSSWDYRLQVLHLALITLFKLLRNCRTVFQNNCTIFHSHEPCSAGFLSLGSPTWAFHSAASKQAPIQVHQLHTQFASHIWHSYVEFLGRSRWFQ
jgi:hypothetical protein